VIDNIDIGFRVGPESIEYWPRLLEEWCLIVERYCRALSRHDVPFWHTEQANVGLLSAAAWRAGLVAIEEFSESRRNGRGTVKTGRCDLWIYSESGTGEGDAYEAKKRLCCKAVRFADQIKKRLKKACDDVQRLDAQYYKRRCGMLFAVPSSRGSVNKEDFIESAKGCLLRSEVDAIAWVFSPPVKDDRNEMNSPPGILLLLKQTGCSTELK
jgi:hypothetical protein